MTTQKTKEILLTLSILLAIGIVVLLWYAYWQRTYVGSIILDVPSYTSVEETSATRMWGNAHKASLLSILNYNDSLDASSTQAFMSGSMPNMDGLTTMVPITQDFQYSAEWVSMDLPTIYKYLKQGKLLVYERYEDDPDSDQKLTTGGVIVGVTPYKELVVHDYLRGPYYVISPEELKVVSLSVDQPFELMAIYPDETTVHTIELDEVNKKRMEQNKINATIRFQFLERTLASVMPVNGLQGADKDTWSEAIQNLYEFSQTDEYALLPKSQQLLGLSYIVIEEYFDFSHTFSPLLPHDEFITRLNGYLDRMKMIKEEDFTIKFVEGVIRTSEANYLAKKSMSPKAISTYKEARSLFEDASNMYKTDWPYIGIFIGYINQQIGPEEEAANQSE